MSTVCKRDFLFLDKNHANIKFQRMAALMSISTRKSPNPWLRSPTSSKKSSSKRRQAIPMPKPQRQSSVESN